MMLPIIYIVSFGVCINALQNFYCQIPCEFSLQNVTHTVCERAEQKCGPDSKCGSNFMVVDLSDDDRQYILDIHNYLRNKVSLGYEKRNNQPTAANMRIMRYNKELEFIAQCWANLCNGNELKHDTCRRTAEYDHVGQNLCYVRSTDPKINKVKSIKDFILEWYDEVAVFDRTWVRETLRRGSNYIVGHYTQLIWADSAEIGCAISYYTQKDLDKVWHQMTFVCNYGPGGNILGAPLYKIGKPASECPEGLTRNSLYKGLCGMSESVKEATNFTFDIFQLE